MTYDPANHCDPDAEITAIDFCNHVFTHKDEVASDSSVTIQDLVDTMLHDMLTFSPGHPRLFEVVISSDGTPSVVWSVRPLSDWQAIVTTSMVMRLMRGHGDR